MRTEWSAKLGDAGGGWLGLELPRVRVARYGSGEPLGTWVPCPAVLPDSGSLRPGGWEGTEQPTSGCWLGLPPARLQAGLPRARHHPSRASHPAGRWAHGELLAGISGRDAGRCGEGARRAAPSQSPGVRERDGGDEGVVLVGICGCETAPERVEEPSRAQTDPAGPACPGVPGSGSLESGVLGAPGLGEPVGPAAWGGAGRGANP